MVLNGMHYAAFKLADTRQYLVQRWPVRKNLVTKGYQGLPQVTGGYQEWLAASE
jgi:hypothetical protein